MIYKVLLCPKAQRRRRSQYVWKVFDIMRERNIAPNATTFSIIVRRFLDDGNLEMALQYLYATKKYQVIPDFSITHSVITFAAQSGHPRLAIDLITWFEQQSVRRFDPTTWMTCLISSAEALYVSLRWIFVTYLPDHLSILERETELISVGKRSFMTLI